MPTTLSVPLSQRPYAASVFACLLGGAFGIHAFLCRYGDAIAGWYLAVPVGLSVLAASGGLPGRLPKLIKWPAISLFLLGSLPFLWLTALLLQNEGPYGAYSYLCKFAPYVTVFYWIRIMRATGLRTFKLVVKVFAAVISLRQLAVFIFPETLGTRLPKAVYDATFVYSFVGTLPRVFGPGMMILGLAALLYIVEWNQGRLRLRGALGLVLALAATVTTQNRGTILIQLACLVCLHSLLIPQSRGHYRVPTAVGAVALLALSLGLVVLADSGALTSWVQGGQDRLSLDTTTLHWRWAQVDRAFSRSDLWWASPFLGVGPNKFVQNDPNLPAQSNELHYSYISVLWTFGVVGLTLLLVPLLTVALFGWRLALHDRETAGWFVGAWMFMAQGAYTGTFTEASSALGITLCVVAVLGSAARLRQTSARNKRMARPAPSPYVVVPSCQ